MDIMTRGEFLRNFDRQVVGYIMEDMKTVGVKVLGNNLPYQIEKVQDKLSVHYRDTLSGQ